MALKFEYKRSELVSAAKELNEVLGLKPSIDITSDLISLENQMIEVVKIVRPEDKFSTKTRAIVERIGDYIFESADPDDLKKAKDKPKGGKGKKEEEPAEKPVKKGKKEEEESAKSTIQPMTKNEKARERLDEARKILMERMDEYGFRKGTMSHFVAADIMSKKPVTEIVDSLVKSFKKTEEIAFGRYFKIVRALKLKGFLVDNPNDFVGSYSKFLRLKNGEPLDAPKAKKEKPVKKGKEKAEPEKKQPAEDVLAEDVPAEDVQAEKPAKKGKEKAEPEKKPAKKSGKSAK